jgi:surface protein
MFQGCSSLTSLDLSNFDTSNVTAMASMFATCTNLTSLN